MAPRRPQPSVSVRRLQSGRTHSLALLAVAIEQNIAIDGVDAAFRSPSSTSAMIGRQTPFKLLPGTKASRSRSSGDHLIHRGPRSRIAMLTEMLEKLRNQVCYRAHVERCVPGYPSFGQPLQFMVSNMSGPSGPPSRTATAGPRSASASLASRASGGLLTSSVRENDLAAEQDMDMYQDGTADLHVLSRDMRDTKDNQTTVLPCNACSTQCSRARKQPG